MIPILFEDAHLLVLNKPAGLSTQAPPIAGPTLEVRARSMLRPDDPGSAYLGLVHRLDRPVSGVILLAKTKRDARRISRQFERRQVGKEYWAIVEGQPPFAKATWEDWLCREETGLGRVQVCSPGTPRSQQALTRSEAIPVPPGDLPDGCAWLRLWPETGRMHQLRVQTSSRGWPILGDQQYGSSRMFEPGIALHARSLTVRHPALDQLMTFLAPLPASWAEQGCRVGEEEEA